MRKLTWTIAFLPTLITAVAVNFMPEKIPAHYNASGDIDRWGSRYELFALPAVILILTGFFELFAYLYENETHLMRPRRRPSAPQNAAVFRKYAPVMAGLLCALHCFLLIKTCADANAGIANLELDSMRFTTFIFGIMFIFMGNYMPKTRRNNTIGFRCSWTLYSDTTWQKGNRFASAALMLAGLCTIVSTAFAGGLFSILLMLAYLTAAIIVSLIYAKRVYDEEVNS